MPADTGHRAKWWAMGPRRNHCQPWTLPRGQFLLSRQGCYSAFLQLFHKHRCGLAPCDECELEGAASASRVWATHTETQKGDDAKGCFVWGREEERQIFAGFPKGILQSSKVALAVGSQYFLLPLLMPGLEVALSIRTVVPYSGRTLSLAKSWCTRAHFPLHKESRSPSLLSGRGNDQQLALCSVGPCMFYLHTSLEGLLC